MAGVKTILNGPSFRRWSKTVMPTQGLLFLYLSISQLNSVKYSRGTVQTSVMSISTVILGHQLALYVVFKLHVATKLLLDSMLLDSGHSVVTMAAH